MKEILKRNESDEISKNSKSNEKSNKKINPEIDYVELPNFSTYLVNIRVEITDVSSVISNKLYGGLLFSDTFIVFNDSVYNLTKDIILSKNFNISNNYLIDQRSDEFKKVIDKNGKFIINQYINSTRTMIIEHSYQGLSYTNNKFNIDFLFPSGFESDLVNHNQLFYCFKGQILVYNDIIILNDNFLSNVYILPNTIDSVQYFNNEKCLYLIISFNNVDFLPYTNVIRNEILLYFIKDYSNKNLCEYLLLSLEFLLSSVKSKVTPFKKTQYFSTNSKFTFKPLLNDSKLIEISNEKKYEYELCFKCLLDINSSNTSNNSTSNSNKTSYNDFFSINTELGGGSLDEFSNDFNITNILDSTVFDENQLEIENLEFIGVNDNKDINVNEENFQLIDYSKFQIRREKVKVVLIASNNRILCNEIVGLIEDLYENKNRNLLKLMINDTNIDFINKRFNMSNDIDSQIKVNVDKINNIKEKISNKLSDEAFIVKEEPMLLICLDSNEFGYSMALLLNLIIDKSMVEIYNTALLIDYNFVFNKLNYDKFINNLKFHFLFKYLIVDSEKINLSNFEKLEIYSRIISKELTIFTKKSFMNKNEDLLKFFGLTMNKSKQNPNNQQSSQISTTQKFLLPNPNHFVYNVNKSFFKDYFFSKGKFLSSLKSTHFKNTERIVYSQTKVFSLKYFKYFFKSILNKPFFSHLEKVNSFLDKHSIEKNDIEKYIENFNLFTSQVNSLSLLKKRKDYLNMESDNNVEELGTQGTSFSSDFSLTTSTFFKAEFLKIDKKQNQVQEYTELLLDHLSYLASNSKLIDNEPYIEGIRGVLKIEDVNYNTEHSNYTGDLTNRKFVYLNIYISNDISIVEEVKNLNKINELGLTLIGTNLNRFSDKISRLMEFFVGKLPFKKSRKTKDCITKEELDNLNLYNFNQPVPDGWYCDGPIFIDNNGKRHTYHPDINKFIDEYLNMSNLLIDEHNKEIEEYLKSKEV